MDAQFGKTLEEVVNGLFCDTIRVFTWRKWG